MFDLDQAIADWRRQMLSAGINTPAPLEELEMHLREDIDKLIKTGLGTQLAFDQASDRLGHGSQLQNEFAQAGGINGLKRRKLAAGFYTVILGVYVLAVTGAMFKNHASAGEWLSGLAAQTTLLSGSVLIWWIGPRIFPLIRSRRVQSATGLVGGISGAIWFVVFANYILPRCEFTVGQLVVAILWAMVPTLLLPNAAFMVLEKSENQPFTAAGN
jgi:hypothetical protein